MENVFISLDGAPAMGDPKARVAMVEFGDYQCPYCGVHANQTLPQIVTDYVKTGKVRYFFKDFPIEAIHPQAFKAAEAARCAGEQGRYWEMHDRLFKDKLIVIMKAAPEFALALGLDVPKFQQCMDSEIYAPQIRKDLQEGRKHNVPGHLSIKLCLKEESRRTLETRLEHGIELRKGRHDGASASSPSTVLQ